MFCNPQINFKGVAIKYHKGGGKGAGGTDGGRGEGGNNGDGKVGEEKEKYELL